MEVHRVVCILKFRYLVHKYPPPTPDLRQIYPVSIATHVDTVLGLAGETVASLALRRAVETPYCVCECM